MSHEAEDVAHDLIVAALRRGLALDDQSFARSVDASARQHAAFLARSAARRRAREKLYAFEPATSELGDADAAPSAAQAPVPAALRTALLLLSLGHTKAELRSALGINDAALRKRLQGLRDRAPLARPAFPHRDEVRTDVRRAQVALMPQLASKFEGYRGGRLLATTDGDGHGIIFFQVLTNDRSAATASASTPDFSGRGPVVKGKPC